MIKNSPAAAAVQALAVSTCKKIGHEKVNHTCRLLIHVDPGVKEKKCT